MPRTLTTKQENFAGDVARGCNLTEAYRNNYATNAADKSVWVDAWQLAQRPQVSLRIQELKAAKETVSSYNVDVARQKLLEVAEKALNSRHYGAAVSALVEVNRISGLHVTKVEISGEIMHRDARLTEFSTDDLRQWIVEHSPLHGLRANDTPELPAGVVDAE